MTEEAVEPQEPIEEIVEQPQEVEAPQEQEAQQEPEQQDHEERDPKLVPLHVVQKERQKRKEMELEMQWMRQKMEELNRPQQEPQEEDDSQYESATKADLGMSQQETLRQVDERIWIRSNPEKYELVNENLPKLLKQRPHLRLALKEAPNRYEEAYELLDKLMERPKTVAREQKQKKAAPNSPGGVPKAAALNEAIDVMKMSDSEYRAWREEKRRRR